MKCTSIGYSALAIVVTWTLASPTRARSQNLPPERATAFRNAAVDYADAMLERGRDTYGQRESPLFSTMLRRDRIGLVDRPEQTIPMTRDAHGVRSGDRAWNAANIDDHYPLYQLLYRLGSVPGGQRYADAADEALGFYAEETAFATGLIPWGEHAAFRLDEDAPTRHASDWSDLKHEHQLGMSEVYPELFRVAPEAMIAYAKANWEEHVYDKDNVRWAHQTRLDGAYADEGFLFARTAGHITYLLALAYEASAEPAERLELGAFISAIATAHNARRHPDSDAVTQWWGTSARDGETLRDIGHSAFNDLQGVIDAQRALDVDVLPATVAAEVHDWVSRSTRTFTTIAHPFAEGGVGYLNRVDLADLSAEPDPIGGNQEPWCTAYGRIGTVASRASDVMLRYRQTGNRELLSLARAAAEWYRGKRPECDVVIGEAATALPIWPQPVASVIDLNLDLYEATGEPEFLGEASSLGEYALDAFGLTDAALPNVFAVGHASAFDHYEAHTGGAALMLSLYRLGNIGSAGAPVPVTLLHFTADVVGPDVKLHWATASETNASHTFVERRDGGTWRRLHSNPARNLPSAYEHTDRGPGAGIHYYRLSFVDQDGSSTQSPVLAVAQTTAADRRPLISPNPTYSGRDIAVLGIVDSEAIVVLYDATGKVLSRQRGHAQTVISTSGLPAGQYTVTILQRASTEHLHLILQP